MVNVSQTEEYKPRLTNKRSMVGLLAMIVLVGMGEHMAERFLPLYLQAVSYTHLTLPTIYSV